jgi:hypothetical protein
MPTRCFDLFATSRPPDGSTTTAAAITRQTAGAVPIGNAIG